MGVKVLIADDHRIVREGLKSLLDGQTGTEVIGEAENGRDAVAMAQSLRPDVVVMDLSMPVLNGIEAISELRTVAPGIKILALSMHSDRRFISRALKEGAVGYLLKDCASDELLKAIRAVMGGTSYMSPQVADVVLADYKETLQDRETPAYSQLTRREREVLQLLAEGRSTKEAAHLLSVSPKTVETHRTQIMGKLNIHSIAELTKFAVREGITDLEE